MKKKKTQVDARGEVDEFVGPPTPDNGKLPPKDEKKPLRTPNLAEELAGPLREDAEFDVFDPPAIATPEPASVPAEPPAQTPAPMDPAPVVVETPVIVPELTPVPRPPTPQPSSAFDLHLPAPVAVIAQPVAPVAAIVTTPTLEERLHRLEVLLGQAQQQQQQTPAKARVTEQPQPREAAKEKGPSVFSQAKALIGLGKHLLPAASPDPQQPKPRGWLVWEMFAELRAMLCMYTDPRYRMSRLSFWLPPGLFVALLLTRFWMHILPGYSLLQAVYLGWVMELPIELLLLYSMFKILGSEARRYRETAPDLPANLRL